ncbi:unnamed protein product [Allacma fusca]|uniref:G protein gamma domain-containing protein n=1 Tax=Allacma fusca TaxID=39272 RepID=A0A8J2Q5E8_9HEXA|nr:unnamed protein product [Allacma fusca]
MTDQNEITKDTLRAILDGLKHHESVEKQKTSESIAKIMAAIQEAEPGDPLIVPIDKKLNPYNEKSGKCIVS